MASFKSIYFKLSACLVLLGAIFCSFQAVMADGGPSADNNVVPHAIASGAAPALTVKDGAQDKDKDDVSKQSYIVMDTRDGTIKLTTDYCDKYAYAVTPATKITLNGQPATAADLKVSDDANPLLAADGTLASLQVTRKPLIQAFWDNFRANLFKPLLLFFYLGFSIPVLKIAFDFPQQIYQGLTIYLLIAIGWHGGEELAVLSGGSVLQALGLIGVGLVTNTIIGAFSYLILRRLVPRMRRVDAATVAAYYGSDSAGTFVTCLGVLQAAHIAYAAYMPVMLAAMEVPGCLVGLYLVSKLREAGMDGKGNMPGEEGFDAATVPEAFAVAKVVEAPKSQGVTAAMQAQPVIKIADDLSAQGIHRRTNSTSALLREVFLNPGIVLLFGGIMIGTISRFQGVKVVQADDNLFISMFQGMLCLFLLEMGMTASKRLQDLRAASWRFVAFGVLAPNLFALIGMSIICLYSHIIHQPLQLGTYVLFAVLCAAASYIAVPAIQRIAIPEASPTLPLAASLGLTFSYNVTIGIPLYMVIAQQIILAFPFAQ